MKILAGFMLLTALLVSSLSAGQIIQTAAFGPGNTDVTNQALSPSFLDFGNFTCPGCTLQSIQITFSLSELIQALTLKNNATGPQTFKFSSTANFDAAATGGTGAAVADAAAMDALLSGASLANLYGQVTITGLASGATYTGSGFSTVTDAQSQTFSDTTNYTPTGTYTLNYSTLTGSIFIGGGGNIGVAQTTNTSGAATVIYNYTTPRGVPEPVSMVLFGSGLLAVSLIGRKKFARK